MATGTRRDLGRVALAVVTSAIVAPPATTEIDVGGQRGEYTYTPPCSGTSYRVAYAEAQVRFRTRLRNGFVVAAEGAGNSGRLESSSPPGGAEVGKRRLGSVGVVRAGFEGRFGGLELGGGGAILGGAGGGDPQLVPSGRAWIGRWGVAHLWGALLAREVMSMNRIVGVGFGHESARLRLATGLGGSAGETTSLFADADYRLWPRAWVGLGFGLATEKTGASIGLRFGWVLGGRDRERHFAAEPDRAPAPETPLPPAVRPPSAPGLDPPALGHGQDGSAAPGVP